MSAPTIRPRSRSPLATLPEVLTIPEAAAALRICTKTAYELARQGRLPTVKLGRRLVVPRRRLLELLDGQQ